MVWAHRLAKLLFPEQLYAVLYQLHSIEACFGGTTPRTLVPLAVSALKLHYHQGSIPQLT